MLWFKKNPAGPDRDLVKEFSEPWDRQRPPVFVGRAAELEVVERNCRRAISLCRKGEDAVGHTILFQGAPGAGKTSLLKHLQKLWSTKEGAPQALVMTKRTLQDPESTALMIAERIAPAEAGRFRQGITSTKSVTGGFKGFASGEYSKSRETGSKVASFEILASLKPPGNREQPLCILIDEIQKVGEEHRACLEALQLGEHGLPIVPIYAGLADSEEKLHQAVSPRLQAGNTRTLSALAPEEVHSYVKQMLDRCRIDCTPDQLERLTARMAERSEGWPQHLHTETAALFRGLHQADCDLMAVDFDAVEKQAAAYREDSYQARQSPEMETCRSLVAAVMAAVPPGGMDKDEVIDAIKGTARTDAGTSWRLPEGMNADMFLMHLVHRGALQPGRERKWSCPIPSLRTWLIDKGSPR